MTELSQDPVEPPEPVWVAVETPEPVWVPVETPEPVWVPQESFQDQGFDQPGSSPLPPPQGPAADKVWTFQNVVAEPAYTPAEMASPWIALVCGLLVWGLVVTGPWHVLLGPGALLPVAAIIFGVLGRRDARKGRTSHGGMATTGMWLGIIAMVPLVLLLFALWMISSAWS